MRSQREQLAARRSAAYSQIARKTTRSSTKRGSRSRKRRAAMPRSRGKADSDHHAYAVISTRSNSRVAFPIPQRPVVIVFFSFLRAVSALRSSERSEERRSNVVPSQPTPTQPVMEAFRKSSGGAQENVGT